MKKSSIIVLFVCSLFAQDNVIYPPYAESFDKEVIEVLEVDTEINWQNSGISDKEAMERCKMSQSLPKDKQQMEEYLKKHKVVWTLHYYSGQGCAYRGKVKFDGKVWDFTSDGGMTTFLRENEEYIYLVCESAECQPRAWNDFE
ncbi:hypothetical protein CQA53_10480 [Helicobacter didelphidarum]|uniref:Uncharacterized protein n=1 Tax=Helicobacter didelphidarum TaxID=2040648 RepID=A0A3D8I7W1_9HELI|nr:hypothetical protein [Helicobacter didelphidarum]RDU61197.1 hypothetical protein CQA53_10480 [Helicobacter didelphidarum]